MRVFIILASIALAHGAKLERTYLPPSNARTAGGSGNFLETPLSRNNYQNNGFTQNLNRFPQSSNEYTQNGNQFPQNNDFTQTGNGNYEAQGALAKNAEFNNVNNFGNFEARPERAQAALERNAAILRQDNSNDGDNYAYAYETENGIYAEENGVATNGVEAQGGYSYTGDDGQVYSIRYTADQNGFVPQGEHIPTPPPVPEEILKALEQNARDEAAGIYDDGSYNEGKYSDNIQQNYQQNNQQNNQQSAFNGNDEDTVVTNAAFSRNYPSADDSPLSTGATASSFNGNRASGVEKAYLPPFAARGNEFGRRQKFDSRNGYRY